VNGLAMRKALHDITHPELHGDGSHLPHQSEDDAYAFRHGRASAKLLGSTEHPAPSTNHSILSEDFNLPDRPFMPNFGNLGTPGEVERKRERRIEGLYAKVFAIGVALVLALGALWYVNAPPAKQPKPIQSGMQYHLRAQTLAAGKMTCELDAHEGCLVCMHKDRLGQTVVNHHC